jgi:ribosomal protein S16
MVVRLRFAMDGIRNSRILRLVATNHRKRRDGKPIELLGIYNTQVRPGEPEKRVEWSPKRIRYWLEVGAVPSRSVVKLLQMVRVPTLGFLCISHTHRATSLNRVRDIILRTSRMLSQTPVPPLNLSLPKYPL